MALAPVKNQLEMFETTPVQDYRAALASATDLDFDRACRIGDIVTFTGTGTVTGVRFQEKKGVVRRITVIEVSAVEIVG